MWNERGKAIIAAAQAMSDLNTFAIVVSILEGGHLHSPSYAGAEKIIAICKREQDKRLREHDAAVKKAGGGTYGREPLPSVPLASRCGEEGVT